MTEAMHLPDEAAAGAVAPQEPVVDDAELMRREEN
jgi:hypothetical protein